MNTEITQLILLITYYTYILLIFACRLQGDIDLYRFLTHAFIQLQYTPYIGLLPIIY